MPPELWFWTLGSILTALIVIGNGVVICLIITRRRLRTTTNLFVLSLALADFGLGASYIPLAAACDLNSSCAAGLIRHCILILFHCSSMVNLCTLTLDRYLAIVNPMRYVIFMNRSGKRRRVTFVICAAWTFPTLLFAAPYLTLKLAATAQNRDFLQKCFWTFLSLVEFCVCVVLFLAMLRILRITRRHVKHNVFLMAQLKFNNRSVQIKSHAPKEAASVICVVVAVFILYHCLDIFDNVCYIASYDLGFALMDVVSLLMLVNSAVNPIAYAFFKKDIKKELQRWLPSIPRDGRTNAVIPM